MLDSTEAGLVSWKIVCTMQLIEVQERGRHLGNQTTTTVRETVKSVVRCMSYE